jgi:hypothetical protein
MSETAERLKRFVTYAKWLKGDEKGEAQVFCDRLFIAFGHAGYKEAGAVLEHRLKKNDGTRGTSFADLVWPGRMLLEMKKRGEKLQLHLAQAFDYWVRAVPNRPRYVVLSNFDEFWVYDFDRQIDQPVDVVRLVDLPRRYLGLNFLFPHGPAPQFGNDREGVTREAADHVAQVFNALVKRGEPRPTAQRFILQSVVAMFAEDMDLLPKGLVSQVIEDCKGGESSYDLLGSLFRQMNSPQKARAGRFAQVPYFNGGLFGTEAPLELKPRELELLGDAAGKDWARVNPAIFGTLFQGSMDAESRHALGAHFTSEADILRVVQPTIVRPWQERISRAASMKDLLGLRKEMLTYQVLDPACGSGNFLYVAYRDLVRLEIGLLAKLRDSVSVREFEKQVKTLSLISPRQFHGIERESFGIELAKVTLMLAKKLALDEATGALDHHQVALDLHEDHALPLDNLDQNFTCGDALFVDWPAVDAIVGNPPYQSKNKMQEEYGRAYINAVRKKYPGVPGRADYCVYWFRRAHDHLKPGQRAGLVGTNTIRQNYSREGGLDYIVKNAGTITEAVSTQVWSGEAAVHVSIVNWIKAGLKGKKRLYRQVGDQRESPWEVLEVDSINSALSFGVDVTDVEVLKSSAAAGGCYQGQTHGHAGFLLPRAEAEALLEKQKQLAEVLFPYLTADELLSEPGALPKRYVIDFGDQDVLTAERRWPVLYAKVKTEVLADRMKAAKEEEKRSAEARSANANAKTNRHHANFLASWWQLSYRRADLMSALDGLQRYITCGRVTKRPIFEFISPGIHPNDALMVFPYEDDYSFGILQSGLHWAWFINRCSTLKGDFRYTSNTVFDTFAWPQAPSKGAVEAVATASQQLRAGRRALLKTHKLTLRELYRSLEQPGKHPLKEAHETLDAAVRAAYGMGRKEDPLAFLLRLNALVAKAEAAGEDVTGPGLPASARGSKKVMSGDCVQMPG